MTDIESITDKIGLPNHMRISVDTFLDPSAEKDSYSVLLNPDSISVNHVVSHSVVRSMAGLENSVALGGVELQGMSVDLLFDSTGSLGKIPLVANESVLEQIDRFMNVVFCDPSQRKDPRWINIIWGDFQFDGFLEYANFTYSHFDSTGSPIRAKAKCSFRGGEVKTVESEQGLDLGIDLGIDIDYSRFKHGINAVQQYGNYISILSNQTVTNLPNSLRNLEELSRLIIKK
jgi:hypothetical protein